MPGVSWIRPAAVHRIPVPDVFEQVGIESASEADNNRAERNLNVGGCAELDPDRVRKLESAMPQVDEIFRKYASDRKIPGMVWGVVIDGRLAHVASAGVRERGSDSPVTASTVFRIASMTKSFTALAILKLRD